MLLQIVVAVAAKKGLSKESAEAPAMAAFEAMLRERFVERAPPAVLAEAAGPIFARRVVSRRTEHHCNQTHCYGTAGYARIRSFPVPNNGIFKASKTDCF